MSAFVKESALIWHNGRLIPWKDATVHILSTAVQFGSSVFEGIRCYKTKNGSAIFRLPEHLKRLHQSCRIYRIDLAYSVADLVDACRVTVRENGMEACYIRPMVLRGYGDMGMASTVNPIETYVTAWEWGNYLGQDGEQIGLDVCVSSWNRPAPNTSPGLAKAAGHYNNAQLIKLDALAKGFAEAIALSPDGLVSEGSGQNVFAVIDGALVTSPINGTNLSGITRDTVIKLAADLGIAVIERPIPRELLYVADELFYTGTATEIVSIRSVDHIKVGDGKIGPVTRSLHSAFQDIITGTVPDRHTWLTSI